MLNSINGVNSYACQDLKGAKDVVDVNSMTGAQNIFKTGDSSCMPKENRSIKVDGQEYEVMTVPDNSPGILSFAQRYKQVVVVDGKQYDVVEVQRKPWENGGVMNDGAKDVKDTKEVVIIDGKQYDVKSNHDLRGDSLIY